MRERWLVCLVLAVFLASLAAPAVAGNGDKIVRTKSSDGLPIISNVCQLLGCTVLLSLDTLPGQTQPSSLFLVRGLLYDVVTLLLSALGIYSIEPDRPIAVSDATPAPWISGQASASVVDQLWDRTPMSYYGTAAWEAYLQQPAADIVGVRATHCGFNVTGAGVVAVIDTGVDVNHPTLRPLVTDGYDFLNEVGGGNEAFEAGQASASVVDGTAWVSPATVAVVDQASASVVDDTDHSAFGHGTMVAGVVHLVAPTAKIMPLRAFGPNGQGYTSNILRAIYYATRKGSKVINMSFSRPTSSPELKRALDNAVSKGLILVSSAGNNGSSSAVYPAALDNTMGIASTSNDDTRSSFSNYGSPNVFVAAPGEGIITTYPGGSFAGAWGTSFSAPFVSGAAALLVGMKSSVSNSQASSAISHAKLLTSDLRYGRLDLYKTVLAGRALWSTITVSPVPTTCVSTGLDWSPVP
jgi:subtilisin family serine protease